MCVYVYVCVCIYIYIYIYTCDHIHKTNNSSGMLSTVEEDPDPETFSFRKQTTLPQIRRQGELPRTSEVCPYIMKYLILRTSEVFFLGVRAIF